MVTPKRTWVNRNGCSYGGHGLVLHYSSEWYSIMALWFSMHSTLQLFGVAPFANILIMYSTTAMTAVPAPTGCHAGC